MFDLTGDDSQDWMAPDRRNRRTTAAAADYSEGDKIETSGGDRGIVVEVRTEPFEGPDGDDVDASEDDPAFIIATVDGAEAVTGDEISLSDWSTGNDSPDEDLAETVAGDAEAALTASVEATLSALPDDFDADEHGTLTAGPTDWDYPDSWDESETPNRLILLDAWSSMGAQFDCGGGCCKGTMTKAGMSDGASDRFCAAMKDRVLMWEGWRK